MKHFQYFFILLISFICFTACKSDSDEVIEEVSNFDITYIRVGNESISNNQEVSLDESVIVGFSQPLNTDQSGINLLQNNSALQFAISQNSNSRELVITPTSPFVEGNTYSVSFSNQVKSTSGANLNPKSYTFKISQEALKVISVTENDVELSQTNQNEEISLNPTFKVKFSHPVSESAARENINLEDYSGSINFTLVDDVTIHIQPTSALSYWKSYELEFETSLGTVTNRSFTEVDYDLFTEVDSTPKFSSLTDEELLTLVQEQTFKYFWNFGHPISGMARERNTSGETVTTGGTGFGLMAMIVAVERGFISRSEAITRWQTIVNFLENADRFHGAWPHWLNGTTGAVQPFSQKDNGADLVETALLVQGLLAVKEYLNISDATESALSDQINTLWEEVEWSWFTKNNEDVLYWHWSPEFNWDINLKIQGHNETQLVYILAAASPTYSIAPSVYINGYTKNGGFANGNQYYNINLPLGDDLGGPLFFAHYSYLGLDPRNLNDSYTNYFTQNKNHSLINYNYSVENPKNFIGYSTQNWGLTASDNHNGYSAHSPTNDLGVITPTAAISSLPYTPNESMDALRFFYFTIGDRMWGDYGFYDAFNASEEWYANSYLAIDQGPIICMIENHRTGLLWNTFMENEDVKAGLEKLGFTF